MNSQKLHSGAIFAITVQGKYLYTGGWDKKVNIQVLVQNLVVFLAIT